MRWRRTPTSFYVGAKYDDGDPGYIHGVIATVNGSGATASVHAAGRQNRPPFPSRRQTRSSPQSSRCSTNSKSFRAASPNEAYAALIAAGYVLVALTGGGLHRAAPRPVALRHTSVKITADIYALVLPELAAQVSGSVASVIPRRRRAASS